MLLECRGWKAYDFATLSSLSCWISFNRSWSILRSSRTVMRCVRSRTTLTTCFRCCQGKLFSFIKFHISLIHLRRLLESYRELQNPANAHAVERKRTPATSLPTNLVTFPESYPFSLIAHLPRAPKSFNGVYQAEGQVLFSPAQGETAIVLLVILLSSPKKYL